MVDHLGLYSRATKQKTVKTNSVTEGRSATSLSGLSVWFEIRMACEESVEVKGEDPFLSGDDALC